MISSFDDYCRGCGEAISKGDDIHWSKDDGARCLECGPARDDERRGSATGDEDQPGYIRHLQKQITRSEERIDALQATAAQQASDLQSLWVWAEALAKELDVEGPKSEPTD